MQLLAGQCCSSVWCVAVPQPGSAHPTQAMAAPCWLEAGGWGLEAVPSRAPRGRHASVTFAIRSRTQVRWLGGCAPSGPSL